MDDFEVEFKQFVNTLPKSTSAAFEAQLTNYVLNQTAFHFKDWLHRVVKGAAEDEELAYIAFLGLIILYRHNEEIARLNLLFEEHGKAFESHITYPYYEGLMYKSNGAHLNAISSFEQALRSDLLKDNVHVLYEYAEAIATVLEQDTLPKDVNQLAEKGKKALDSAIELRPKYALYYATEARYFIFEEKFNEAGYAVNEAIRLEERGHDYQLRVAKYHQLASIIQVKEEINLYRMQQKKFNEQLNNRLISANEELTENVHTYKQEYEKQMRGTQEMLEDMKQQNLQMLGFFTAIITFTVGSIQIIREQSFIGAALLLLVLAGVLLIAYAGFGFLMFSIQKRAGYVKEIIVLVIGLALIVLSLLAYNQQWFG